jgi:hypothetical protein
MAVSLASWMAQPIVQRDTTSRKKGAVVYHKIFADCAAISSDPFWCDIFTEAASNQLPPYFSYTNGELKYRKRGVASIIQVPSDPITASLLLMKTFEEKSNLISPNRPIVNQLITPAVRELITWSSLSANNRLCLRLRYIHDVAREKKLSKNEINQLRQLINIGFTQRYFDTHSITMNYDRISQLSGLLWHEPERRFSLAGYLKPTVTRQSTKKVPPSKRKTSLLNIWRDYMSHYNRLSLIEAEQSELSTIDIGTASDDDAETLT